MTPLQEDTFRTRLARLLQGSAPPGKPAEPLAFRVMYERFREILLLNDSLHQLIADVEEKRAGRAPFVIEAVLEKIRQGLLEALIMVKDLNQMAGNRYSELYYVLEELNRQFEREVANEKPASGPLTLPLSAVGAGDALAAGTKMANLGEVKNALRLLVPEGFVITTAAFRRFMEENGLWERAHQLKRMLAQYGSSALAPACREVREAILAAPLPARLEQEFDQAFARMAGAEPGLAAVRSSAVGEDQAASHAGQYYSELKVSRGGLRDAYRLVLASLYQPYALSYRFERGRSEAEAMMAVGCLQMIAPRVSGVLFSRNFRHPEADQIELGFTAGLADQLVQGATRAEQHLLGPEDLSGEIRGLLSSNELKRLYELARRLESHFSGPQDIEWALDEEERLFVLQTRPMIPARPTATLAPLPATAAPILAGGQMACPGAGSGPVARIESAEELEAFPRGGVAVIRQASPAFSRIMTRASAIVAEIGSPIGHLSIIAREFGVPMIVGLEAAWDRLAAGRIVTVDASAGCIYEGALSLSPREAETPSWIADSPSLELLRRVARWVTPLRLIDPAAAEFGPAGCRSLHDLTRLVHEKLYETMFQFGDRARKRLPDALRLEVDLPLEVRLVDVAGGLRPGAGAEGRVRLEDVVSAPLRSLLEGLTDPRIDWRKPRPISAAGFMSVVGTSLLTPPAELTELATVSFVVVAEHYLNFSIKAGYHFSVIDAFCDRDPNHNYLNFRFAGGGAGEERRRRRVRFLSAVLTPLDFLVRVQGDLLLARLEKLPPERILARLTDLGRLTLCSRQLDMLMDSDQSPADFSEAFLAGEFARF